MQQQQPVSVEPQQGMKPAQSTIFIRGDNIDERNNIEQNQTKHFQLPPSNMPSQQNPTFNNSGIDIDNDSSNQSQKDPYQCQVVISEDCANQVVTLLVQPGQSMWYKGQIIASNRSYSNKDIQAVDRLDIQRILHYFKLKWNIPKKLTNAGPDMAYFCIRRRLGGGKILYLQQEVYNELFIVDFSKILTINCDPIDFQLKSVNYLPYLSKFKFKDKKNKLSVLLQSNSGNMIYEKSLGLDEKLYLGNSSILAMSQSVWVTKQQTQIVLSGPGYVFLEAPSLPIPYQNIKNALMAKIFIIFFFFTLFFMFTI